ncbi:hypothetical protein ACVWWG_002497 [Bradyrhizobium sp. LB7.2]
MTADDAPPLQREQIDGILVVIGIDLAAIRFAKCLPVALFDEDVVPAAGNAARARLRKGDDLPQKWRES